MTEASESRMREVANALGRLLQDIPEVRRCDLKLEFLFEEDGLPTARSLRAEWWNEDRGDKPRSPSLVTYSTKRENLLP